VLTIVLNLYAFFSYQIFFQHIWTQTHDAKAFWKCIKIERKKIRIFFFFFSKKNVVFLFTYCANFQAALFSWVFIHFWSYKAQHFRFFSQLFKLVNKNMIVSLFLTKKSWKNELWINFLMIFNRKQTNWSYFHGKQTKYKKHLQFCATINYFLSPKFFLTHFNKNFLFWIILKLNKNWWKKFFFFFWKKNFFFSYAGPIFKLLYFNEFLSVFDRIGLKISGFF